MKKRHNIKNLIVVDDAAMISADNIGKLKAAQIDYIVGARLGNLQANVLISIDRQLQRDDLANIFIDLL